MELALGDKYVLVTVPEFQSVNKRANAAGLMAYVTYISDHCGERRISFQLVSK